MNPILLIPARMASNRLPGKPLAEIAGKPMIVRVAERARAADIGPVAVATDSADIADVVRGAGFTAVMTRADHPSGSDRVHEAAGICDPAGAHDAVINLQGDLPLIEPDVIAAAANALARSSADIATVAAPIADAPEATNPNVVKVVATETACVAPGLMRALYFTRATAPSGEGTLWHHIGIYAWRRAALARFVTLEPSPLEQRERLEQLRALEHGMEIVVAQAQSVPFGVDTPEDLERARAMALGETL